MSGRSRRRLAAYLLGGVVLALVVVSILAATVLAEPQVVEVSSAWGAVTEATSEIRVTAVIDNPNPIGVPPVLAIGYRVSMNDVVVADGREGDIGIRPGRNRLGFTIDLRNDLIDDWWVTHLNGGERSTLTIDPRVEGPFGISQPLPPERQPIDTDILAPMRSSDPVAVELGDDPFLVIEEQTADWERATAETMPVTVRARLTNEHSAPIHLDGIGYAVRMNAVTLGEGETDEAFVVESGETETLAVTAVLNTPRIVDWWVSHLRNGEVTTMSVDVYGVVAKDGTRTAVPLDFIGLSSVFRTDLLGGGEPTVEAIEPEEGFAFEQPEIRSIDLAWGEVTDAVTEIEATVSLTTPEESPFLELASLEIEQTMTINDVVVARDATSVGSDPIREGSLPLTVRMDNALVPEWWAAHINRGETSTVLIDPTATVDVGMTTFPLEIPSMTSGFSTDLLADLNEDRPRHVEAGGVRLLTVRETRASWGRATPEAAPIAVEVALQNRGAMAATVSDIEYRVALNGVVLADDAVDGSYTVAPGADRTIRFTIVLDNSRMDEWWVTHVRNGERTRVSMDLTATVSSAGFERTVALDGAEPDAPIETDILGG